MLTKKNVLINRIQISKISCIVIFFTFILAACGYKVKSSTTSDNAKTQATNQLNNDATALEVRMKASSDDIPINAVNGDLVAKPVNFTLTLVASLAPPTVAGKLLQATNLFLNKTKAYVTYNMAGEDQLGALDVIDVTNKNSPKIVSELLFLDSDANAVSLDGNTAYVVGATSAGEIPAYLKTITLDKNGIITDSVKTYALPSFAGTGVLSTDSYVIAASGDEGGISIFNKTTMELLSTHNQADARSISSYDKKGNIVALSGQPGRAFVYDNDGNFSTTYSLGGNSIAGSKSTIEAGKDYFVASLGNTGFAVVCNDGTLLSAIPAITVKGLPAANTVTNAVSTDTTYLFAANGEAGIYVYTITESGGNKGGCKNQTLTLNGSLGLGDTLSANHVYFRSPYLFVADGLGGLKIIIISST